MKKIQYIFLFVIVLCGCSTSKVPTKLQQTLSESERLLDQQRRDEALKRFINGAAYDAKGQFAEAALEYQEALQYDTNATIFYALSRDYAALNKPARAAEMIREAIRLKPNSIPYREHLANLYIATFQFDLAMKEYETITTIDSTYLPAWYALAQLYQRQRPLKALEVYERLLEQEGDQLDILFQCASIYTALEQYNKAIEYFSRMLLLDPSNRPLKRQIVDVYIKAGKLDEATKILEQLFEDDPSDAEVIATLADIALQEKQFKKAIELYDQLLQQGVDNYEVKLRIGVGFFGLTEEDSTAVDRAQTIFKELEAANQKDWRPLWYLGAIAAGKKNDSLAQTYFQRVTQLAEWNTDAWWFLGTSQFEQGKYTEALKTMDQAIKASPNDFRFYYLKGLIYQRLEQEEKAIQQLELAHKLNPKDIGVLSSLALLYDNRKEFNKSDSLYEEALRIDPKAAIILNNYSYSLCERGLQLERCLKMSQDAVAAEPNNSAYLDTYGWILYRLGRYSEAAEYIEKAIAAGDASAVVHEHLGDVYFKLGNVEKALYWWKQALEMEPQNEEVKKKIERGSL